MNRILKDLISLSKFSSRFSLLPITITNCRIESARHIHSTFIYRKKDDADHSLVKSDLFGNINDQQKNKETFLAAVNMYYTRDVKRRAHVEFITSALNHMEEFGVHKDLQAYKNILDVMPKGKFIPTNLFQAEFMHYPKQQDCALKLLEQMENNGVMPDVEMETMVMNIFGKHGFPTKKLLRMSYWMPKFKNLSPWPLAQKLPKSPYELAKIAIQRMCSVDAGSQIEIFDTKEVEDSIDDTWIVSGQSPKQRELIEKMQSHETVYVEGAFLLWLRDTSINYFILRSEPVKPTEEEQKEYQLLDYDDTSQIKSWILGQEETKNDAMIPPSVHEQEDGNILAICITGTSSKDSLLSWIRLLQVKNPKLAHLPILFSTHSPLGEVTKAIDSGQKTDLLQDQPKIEAGPDPTSSV
nr:EOG090X07J4 [Sida crystallina]